MGKALAEAALHQRHEVVIVSGPVEVVYPSSCRVIPVVSTEEMLAACRSEFAWCDGLIGVAAPCDYRPVQVAPNKIAKTGEPLELHLIETDDVVATLGAIKTHQWLVGFALETEDRRLRALAKLEKKHCDLMVLNGPAAMNSPDNSVEIMDPAGRVIECFSGTKEQVGERIFAVVERRLIERRG
jgi:phosphopantothenoylcysteine decarboxylase/phosphopantothenate--cysteine ligase